MTVMTLIMRLTLMEQRLDRRRHGADARDTRVASGHWRIEGDDWLRLQAQKTHVADVTVAVTDPHLAGTLHRCTVSTDGC